MLNVFSSSGSIVLAAAYLMPLCYLAYALARGPRAPANPWNSTGLEWQTQSPPRTENFSVIPVVTEPPYSYPRPEERVHAA